MSAAVEPISILQPVSEEAENRKQEAKRHWSIICKSGGLVSVNSLKIGWHAFALKRDNLFGILGFENEKEAQVASGVGDSTWFNVISIAQEFSGAEEDLFVGMKLSNAKLLTNLPESKRLTEYWIRRAGTDSLETFKDAIDGEMNGKARPSDGKEGKSTLHISMPTSRKKVVEAGLKEYAKSIGVDGDESRALELLVVEHTGSTTLIGTITTSAQICKQIKELCESGLSSDEVLAKVIILNEEMILGFSTALEQVQNLESSEK